MARHGIAAGLRLWLDPLKTRFCGQPSKIDDTMADATETAMSSSKDERMCLSERM